MKLLRYLANGFPKVGIFSHGLVMDLPTQLSVLEILNLPQDLRERLESQAGRYHRIPLDKVQLLPPVEPKVVRDFVSFHGHISGMKKAEPGDGSVPEAWFETPVSLLINPYTVKASGQPIPVPALTKAMDYELEVAVILRKPAEDVTPEQASDLIGGYCILNDWSARDLQSREMSVGLGPSKGKDFATTIGPWITTPEELEKYREGDRYALPMSVSVNGKEMGSYNLKYMSWSFEELISHSSRSSYVGAGDVLASGTAHGGSLAEHWAKNGSRENPAPLQAGDVVTMTVEGLGTIYNPIVPTVSPGHTVGRARIADEGH